MKYGNTTKPEVQIDLPNFGNGVNLKSKGIAQQINFPHTRKDKIHH
ncbi:hypothetical protein LV83_01620 [Algoriphagus yeomjeoni]|uniref:Uncharacterized protein n=1 Tax=Algoriphagus yeomjeoni TaxID=291403 RepID=A0A327PGR3_9BACT|nr:hypothetical protein LV83_01620 [Algoriphagus yeomjeoni]